jgi:putative SOS response-associated peptidase YedK
MLRFCLTSPDAAVRRMFRLPDAADGDMIAPPRYDIAPTQPVAIVRVKPGLEAVGERELALVRWGLIPAWVKDPRDFKPLMNARAETLPDKPSFKHALRYRRCLVPADGYYEWVGAAGAKSKHLIRPKPGSALVNPIGFAGLWEHWLGAEGSEIETLAIITVPANETVKALGARMPAIVPPRRYADWLDVRRVDAGAALRLLEPAPEDVLEHGDVTRDLDKSAP